MGNENVIDFKVFDFKFPELVLGGFATIEQKGVLTPDNYLGGLISAMGRGSRVGTQNGDCKVQMDTCLLFFFVLCSTLLYFMYKNGLSGRLVVLNDFKNFVQHGYFHQF